MSYFLCIGIAGRGTCVVYGQNRGGLLLAIAHDGVGCSFRNLNVGVVPCCGYRHTIFRFYGNVILFCSYVLMTFYNTNVVR